MTVTPEQIQQFRDRIANGRQPVARAEMNGHPRGWNDALDFVERQLKDVLGEAGSDQTLKQ